MNGGSQSLAATSTPSLLRPGEPWTVTARTLVGMAFDTIALHAAQGLVDRILMPAPGELARLRASAAPYVTAELRREPRRFFDFLDAPPSFSMRERARSEQRHGVVVTREFTTAYAPYVCPGVGGSCREDTRVTVEHWMHDEGTPAGTVVALHGFVMPNPRLCALALRASEWFDRGLDVVLMKLPFQALLAGRHPRLADYFFPSAEVGHVNEAIRQAVHEVRLVTTWLRSETRAPVGLLGLSLGGYVAALMAALTPDLDFVIPVTAPVCIGDLAWRFFARSRRYRASASPPPAREEVRDFYRVHSPLTHPRRVPRERALIIAGRGDRIVPPDQPLALRRHWDEAEIRWFAGSHFMPFRRAAVVPAVVRHLQTLGIL